MAVPKQPVDASGRPLDGADWIVAAREAFQDWRSGSDTQGLARSAAILNSASSRRMIDP